MKKSIEEKLLDILESSLKNKVTTDQYNGAKYEEVSDDIDPDLKDNILNTNLLCSLKSTIELQLKTDGDMEQYRNWNGFVYSIDNSTIDYLNRLIKDIENFSSQ